MLSEKFQFIASNLATLWQILVRVIQNVISKKYKTMNLCMMSKKMTRDVCHYPSKKSFYTDFPKIAFTAIGLKIRHQFDKVKKL